MKWFACSGFTIPFAADSQVPLCQGTHRLAGLVGDASQVGQLGNEESSWTLYPTPPSLNLLLRNDSCTTAIFTIRAIILVQEGVASPED